ncbi:MAG: restriction endonuclease subunit S [Saprospiraceae bacterium]|nr:restriction endonuclease subunit S [Candidatus Vicinibacter affinis]
MMGGVKNKEIQSDWEFIPLGEVFKLTSGKTKPNKLFDEPIDENIYPVFGGNGIMGFASEFNSEGENILIGRVGEYCGITRFVSEKCWITDNALFSKEFLKDVDAKYLAYKLQLEDLSRLRNKGGQPLISQGPISIHKVSLPKSLPEQKAISQVLCKADAAIHTTEKLIAQKELRKKWLMQQLLTGKKRLKGLEGEWKKQRLEKYLVKHDEKSTVNNQFPVLTSSRRGIFLQSDYYTRDVASEDNTGYNVVPRGYFTYRHMSDDLIFKFNINDIVDKGIVSTLYPVFTTKDINSYFLLVKLNEGSEFKMHAEEQKQGGSRTYIYFKTLCQLKFNLPSLEEQNAIAQVLQAADKEISLLKAKAEKLREQKKGLMQQLLTGKVRLKIN